MVIKSTISAGFVEQLLQKLNCQNFIFSPEFSRQVKTIFDILHSSQILEGKQFERAKLLVDMLEEGEIKKDIPILFTNSTEAELIKLFANTHLAMRVAYFNELDTYAAIHSLDTCQIIEDIDLDPRVGPHYSNSSFDYSGYCPPKYIKQPLANH